MSDCIYNTNCLKEEQDFYRENFITDETEPDDIATEDLEDSDYKNLRIAIATIDRLNYENQTLKALAKESLILIASCDTQNEEIEKLKALSEQLEKDCDVEHQRYLEVQENYSWRLCEVCEYLGIDNDDTSEKIIKEIKRDREEKNEENHTLKAILEPLILIASRDTPSLTQNEEIEKLKAENERDREEKNEEIEKLKAENEKLKADFGLD